MFCCCFIFCWQGCCNYNEQLNIWNIRRQSARQSPISFQVSPNEYKSCQSHLIWMPGNGHRWSMSKIMSDGRTFEVNTLILESCWQCCVGRLKAKVWKAPHLKLAYLSSGGYKTVTPLKACCPYAECYLWIYIALRELHSYKSINTYKELSSPIFQSLSVSQWVRDRDPVIVSPDKISTCSIYKGISALYWLNNTITAS